VVVQHGEEETCVVVDDVELEREVLVARLQLELLPQLCMM
jgi:hypothetical protein